MTIRERLSLGTQCVHETLRMVWQEPKLVRYIAYIAFYWIIFAIFFAVGLGAGFFLFKSIGWWATICAVPVALCFVWAAYKSSLMTAAFNEAVFARHEQRFMPFHESIALVHGYRKRVINWILIYAAIEGVLAVVSSSADVSQRWYLRVAAMILMIPFRMAELYSMAALVKERIAAYRSFIVSFKLTARNLVTTLWAIVWSVFIMATVLLLVSAPAVGLFVLAMWLHALVWWIVCSVLAAPFVVCAVMTFLWLTTAWAALPAMLYLRLPKEPSIAIF